MKSFNITLDDLKALVAKKMIELFGREAKKYQVHEDRRGNVVISFGGCVVAMTDISLENGVSILPNNKTEQGVRFAIELAALDPTVWWKVIYYSESDLAAVFCGDNVGRRTPEEALAELTPEVMTRKPRLVSFVNAGCMYNNRLDVLTFQMITGDWQKPNVSDRVFEDQAFIFKYC